MTTDVLRQLPEHPDVEVTIGAGIEHWAHGHVELSVRGDGAVQVRSRRSGSKRRFDAELDRDRVRTLGVELAELGLDRLRAHSGNREPDDVPVTVAVTRDGDVIHRADLWYGDRYDDPNLERLLARYEALVDEVTAGALPYGEGRRTG